MSSLKRINSANINCEAGRRLGCQTFCCRLLVRLDPDERESGDGVTPSKGFVDKTPDGDCIHLDRVKELCGIWHKRPRVCREYECNSDYLLQVVLKNGFTSLGRLVKEAASAYIPKEIHVQIPARDQTSDK